MIAEWLQLDGFLTQTNLPVGVSPAGGRNEADVVGARIKEGTLEIRHIETGGLAGGRNSTDSIKNKFADWIKEHVTGHFKDTLSFEGPCTYRTLYVATFWAAPVIQDLKEAGVEVVRMPDFIRDKVLPTVQKGKENLARRLRMKSPRATLPQSLWLLQMLDHLEAQHMLRKEP
ncbi:MAG: hypothetical protein ABIF82_04340 [Planctomycetota bacterium]